MYSTWTGDKYDNKVEEWKLQRYADIGRYEGLNLYVEIAGMSGLRVGQIIDVVVPSPEKVLEQNPGKVKNPDDLIDKYLSGTYLITTLKHMIAWNSGKPVYTMLAEVTKDALAEVPSYGGRSKNVR